jgi:hypothetical protein
MDNYVYYMHNMPVEVLMCSSEPFDDNHKQIEIELCQHKWKTFDPQDPTAVAREGFFAGNYFDQSQIYIGRVLNTCGGQMSARISVNGSEAVGAYSFCQQNDFFNNSNVQYLVKNSNYTYFWHNTTSDGSYWNNIEWDNSVYSLVISRVAVKDRNNASFFVLPNTFLNIGSYFYNPIEEAFGSPVNDQIQMLLCSTSNSTEAVPKHKLIDHIPCGKLKTLSS